MKKLIIAVLIGTSCLSVTNAFAQKGRFLKTLREVRTNTVIPRNMYDPRLVPHVPGVYIPAHTVFSNLQDKIATVAQTAAFKLEEEDAYLIAHDPLLLQQFQEDVHPVFEGHPLPEQQSIAILRENQAKFAQARANNEYEDAWIKFVKRRQANPARHKSLDSLIKWRSRIPINDNSKLYELRNDLKAYESEMGEDVYDFYVEHIGLEGLPRVRALNIPSIEGVVLEIPVNGLKIVHNDGSFGYLPEDRVIIRTDDDGACLFFSHDVFRPARSQTFRFHVIRK